MPSVSKLALGTAQFGFDYGITNKHGQISKSEAMRILHRMRATGIDMIDTAANYGSSEERLGEAGITGLKVITKVPSLAGSRAAGSLIRSAVANSLVNLKIERLYGLLLHRPADLIASNAEEVYTAMVTVKQAGLVENIGISAYSPEEIDPIIRRFSLDIVQAPYNVLDRRMLYSGCMDKLAKNQIQFHARSVFLQGLLLLSENQMPSQFKVWSKVWTTWYEWLKEVQLTPLEACVGFVASDAQIDRIVVGIDSLAQLNQIIHAVEKPLTEEIPTHLSVDDCGLINPSTWIRM